MFSLLADKLQDVFKDLRGHGQISETNITDAMRAVRMALLEADVEFGVAKGFIARVKDKALGEAVLRGVAPGQQIVKIFHDELTALLGGDNAPLNLDKPAFCASLRARQSCFPFSPTSSRTSSKTCGGMGRSRRRTSPTRCGRCGWRCSRRTWSLGWRRGSSRG